MVLTAFFLVVISSSSATVMVTSKDVGDELSTLPRITDLNSDVDASDGAPTGLASTQPPKSEIPPWIPVVAVVLTITVIGGLAVVLGCYRCRSYTAKYDVETYNIASITSGPTASQPLPPYQKTFNGYTMNGNATIIRPNTSDDDHSLYYDTYVNLHSDLYMTPTGSPADKNEQHNTDNSRNTRMKEIRPWFLCYLPPEKETLKNSCVKIDSDSFKANKNVKPGSIVKTDFVSTYTTQNISCDAVFTEMTEINCDIQA